MTSFTTNVKHRVRTTESEHQGQNSISDPDQNLGFTCVVNETKTVFHIFRLLFRLKENKATGTWQNKEVEMCNPKVCQHPLQSTFIGHMTSFGLDEEGNTHHAGMSTCVIWPQCATLIPLKTVKRAQ